MTTKCRCPNCESFIFISFAAHYMGHEVGACGKCGTIYLPALNKEANP